MYRCICAFCAGFTFLLLTHIAMPAYANESIEQVLQHKFDRGLYSSMGADTCLKCHDGLSATNGLGIFDNLHGHNTLAGGPFDSTSRFGLQCEACHGPDGNHSRSRIRPGQSREPMITFGVASAVSADGQNSVCLSCHSDFGRLAWHGSEHQMAALRCSDCHSLHQTEMPAAGCESCHREQTVFSHVGSGFAFNSFGEFAQELPTCIDCHNAHGSLAQAALQTANTVEQCTECHADKRGPFLWEHAPVSEDCTLCHGPHGSMHNAQLTAQPPLLCQNCHAEQQSNHQSAGYFNTGNPGTAPYLMANSCLNCHSQIHGSNHPSGNSFQR